MGDYYNRSNKECAGLVHYVRYKETSEGFGLTVCDRQFTVDDRRFYDYMFAVDTPKDANCISCVAVMDRPWEELNDEG